MPDPKSQVEQITVALIYKFMNDIPRGFAFVWRRFEIPDLPQPMLACAMLTVPANKLLRDTILEHDPDPRMPAILEDADWKTWLGE